MTARVNHNGVSRAGPSANKHSAANSRLHFPPSSTRLQAQQLQRQQRRRSWETAASCSSGPLDSGAGAEAAPTTADAALGTTLRGLVDPTGSMVYPTSAMLLHATVVTGRQRRLRWRHDDDGGGDEAFFDGSGGMFLTSASPA